MVPSPEVVEIAEQYTHEPRLNTDSNSSAGKDNTEELRATVSEPERAQTQKSNRSHAKSLAAESDIK